MSNYLCDTCTRIFPGGSQGSTFLVKPNGYTAHCCSGACLRAYVNGQPLQRTKRLVVPILVLAGFACGVAISSLLNHVAAN
jgi:hypothetical protein